MPVSHKDMQECLKNLGCRTVHQVKKVTEYMLPETKFAFYLHIENLYPQVVLPPALEVYLDELASLPGVTSKEPYYHNADMSRFPKRTHGGKSDIHYGLAFEFDNSLAVEQFINRLLGIVK